MALIKCPECDGSISEKAKVCIHCGFPLEEKEEDYYFDCPNCSSRVKVDSDYCDCCGIRVSDYLDGGNESFNDENESDVGVYKMHLFRGKEKVYCPKCGSVNCSIYFENYTVSKKTKVSYSANLNPFRPFTLLNKKEKIVRPEQSINVKRFVCNQCGNIFR